MFRDMLNQTMIVKRMQTIKDPVTHITTTQLSSIGSFSCSIGKQKNITLIQSEPQSYTTQKLMLFTEITADLKGGDIVTIDNIDYIVNGLYKPRNHHIEADISVKQEV